ALTGNGDGAVILAGTPAYLAPEQIRGDPATPRTDLYSLGAMLYEAMAGELPHQATDLRDLIYAKLTELPTALRLAAPHVPEDIARLVDYLLAPDPEHRPRSAAEVLEMLRGQPKNLASGSMVPRLGGDEPVRSLLDAARKRRAVDVIGRPGLGRSRCLRGMAEMLSREGIRVVWLPPSNRPFARLEPIVGHLDDFTTHGLDAIISHIEPRVRAALRDGAVLIADDAEHIDRWSCAILERC